MKTYDPKNHLISLGSILLGSFGEDTFLECERDEDGFMAKVGASGEVCRIKNNNKMGKIKFTCMAQSATNDALSAIVLGDELTGNGVLPFFAKEFGGTTVVKASECWITKMPATARAKELGHVEWVIQAAELYQFNGGLL